jgi:hypothetical protein
MAESLRDQLAANFDKITTVDAKEDTAAPATPVADTPAPASPPSSKIAEAPKPAAAKPAATIADDDRPRGPDGKFIQKEDAPAKEPIPSAAKIHKAPAPGSPQAEAALPQAPTLPAKPRPARPSSWKKEYWEHWDKLDPALAEYLHTRESQYASGVSTYKAEAEASKPLMEAMQQFIPELKQHNIEPTRWITELGHVHRMLALGTPAQKLQTLNTVLRAYGVPVQALFDQNAQQQYLQQGQFQQPLQLPPQQAMLTRADAERLFQEQFVQVDADRELQRFAADAEKHPHYEELRETMSGLLQANLAEDLESAYQAALRHPRHSDLWNAIQQQDRAAQEEQRKAAEAQRVLKAKGKAVSPQSATPSGPGSEDKPKGLRSNLESAFDSVVGGARV